MTVIDFPKTTCPCRSEEPDGPKPQRLQLPVAVKSNGRSRFAPPGKPAPAMLPNEVMNWLDGVLSKGTRIETVEISGPGDPLAIPGPTFETLQKIRERYPELPVYLVTIGIGGDKFAQPLANLGIKNIAITVDTVTAATVEQLYAWIRPTNKTIPLATAAKILIDEQAKTVAAFAAAGITVVIRTTVYPGINDDQIESIAKTMAALGASEMELLPCLPASQEGDNPPPPSRDLLQSLEQGAIRHLTIKEKTAAITINPHNSQVGTPLIPKPSAERPNVAVVSSNGMDIDLHLGHAIRMLIYGPREDGLPCLLETRDAPEPGGGGARWQALAKILPDCFALLTASAGDNPRKILGDNGITVLVCEDNVEGTVDVLY
ncbi:MAG: radical SAM protein, partial [Desulfobulbaceae bacterium]|nr:radical SAM protein [Desulfobulbaceae bacterium]